MAILIYSVVYLILSNHFGIFSFPLLVCRDFKAVKMFLDFDPAGVKRLKSPLFSLNTLVGGQMGFSLDEKTVFVWFVWFI